MYNVRGQEHVRERLRNKSFAMKVGLEFQRDTSSVVQNRARTEIEVRNEKKRAIIFFF